MAGRFLSALLGIQIDANAQGFEVDLDDATDFANQMTEMDNDDSIELIEMPIRLTRMSDTTSYASALLARLLDRKD